MTISAVANAGNSVWSKRPPSTSWDPTQAVRWSALAGGRRGYVPLGHLLRDARQGVSSASLDRGEIAVRAARVTDIHPLLLGEGERRLISAKLVQRHLVAAGDVLVARVGRVGRASCVTGPTNTLVPRDGVLVARPQNWRWGPAIAAALCTESVRKWLGDLTSGIRSASLTIDQLREVPVPSPDQYDFDTLHDLIDRAGWLISESRGQIEEVRGKVGLFLEGAPTEPLSGLALWLDDVDVLPGWSWQDVQRYWVRRRARWAVHGLQRLADAVDLVALRPKTNTAGRSPNFTIEADDVRSDWYLALPEQRDRDGELGPTSSRKRCFAVEREALLIPTVGDIAAAPVLVPQEVFDREGQPLQVPISWLPLIGLTHSRSLAVVMDHPFLQLQRRLRSAFSTVSYLTREEMGELLVPRVPVEILSGWEETLQRAQARFIEANDLAKQAVAIVEEWYA